MESIDFFSKRFDRLRKLITEWEFQLSQIPGQVMHLFDQQDLAGIGHLLKKKRRLLELIGDLKDFIQKWEGSGEDFVEVAKVEYENNR